MNRKLFLVLMTLTICPALTPWAAAQDTESAAPAMPHDSSSAVSHHACPMMSADHRADEGMGFSQAKTTHHFFLTADGGVISVEANDAKDSESREEIGMHLAHIAKAFAAGNFDIPMFVHDQVPDGVPVMRAKKDAIHYRFEEMESGGRVVISSEDRAAVGAIHEFLAFQIREHKTGDSLVVR